MTPERHVLSSFKATGRLLARLLAGLVVVLTGCVMMLGAVAGIGFDKDGFEDVCNDSPRLRPPPGSGVSQEVGQGVDVGLHPFPIGLDCIYQGPQGEEIVVNDIKLWPTLAFAAGPALMLYGVCLPFRRRRLPRGARDPRA